MEGSIEGSGSYPTYNGATVYAPDVRELAWSGFIWTGRFDTVGKKNPRTLFSPVPTTSRVFSECPNCKLPLTDWSEQVYAPKVHKKLSPDCRHHKLAEDEDADGWIDTLSEEEAKRIFDTAEKRGVTFSIDSWIILKKRAELGRLNLIQMPASDDGMYLVLQCLCGCGRKFLRWNGRMCSARKLHESKNDAEAMSEGSFSWSSSKSE